MLKAHRVRILFFTINFSFEYFHVSLVFATRAAMIRFRDTESDTGQLRGEVPAICRETPMSEQEVDTGTEDSKELPRKSNTTRQSNRRCSSEVEQTIRNRQVKGSIPFTGSPFCMWIVSVTSSTVRWTSRYTGAEV